MKSYQILSLDIWDTVLRRRRHPDEIKLATARNLYLTHFEQLKVDYQNVEALLRARVTAERWIAEHHPPHLDNEYDIQDVFAKMLEEVLQAPCDRQPMIRQLYQFELDQELKSVYLDPHIVETVSRYSFEKLGYISDFYAGSAFIDALLEKAAFPFQIDFRYVSCDYGRNKRSGKLFQKVMEDLGTEAGAQLHLGDNPESDVAVPKALGIHAVRYLPEGEHEGRKRRESLYSIDKGHRLEQILGEIRKGRSTADELAPFFFSYILWVIEDCVRRKIKKIYYFTREGEFFIQIHRKIAEHGLFPEDLLPEARVLEVSRLATFAASLREVSLTEMMRLWNQYSVQSMRAFAKSLALPEETFQERLERHGLLMDEVLTYPWLDDRVKELFSDPDFVSFIGEHIHALRAQFLGYAGQRGLTLDKPEEVAVVDIGWRGSIQDNICLLFPGHRLIGYYLALEQFLNSQPSNAEKHGFINGLPDYQALLRMVAPVEMLCNSPNGSTVGYEEREPGMFTAVRKKEASEDSIFEGYTEGVQREILAAMEGDCRAVLLHSLMAEQLRPQVYSNFKRLLLNPRNHRDLIAAFFQLRHNEEFGVGCFVDKRTRLRLTLMMTALWSKKSRGEWKAFLNSTSWPQGYLAKYHLYPLVNIYNHLLGIEREEG